MNDQIDLPEVKAVANAIAAAFMAGKEEQAAGTASRKQAMGNALESIKAYGLKYPGDENVGKRAVVSAFLQTRAIALGWSDKTTTVRQSECCFLLDNAADIPAGVQAWRPTVDKIRRSKKSVLDNLRADLAAVEVAVNEGMHRIAELEAKIAAILVVEDLEKQAA